MDIQKQITDKLINNLYDKFDEIIIEGLRLKGHEFDSRQQIETFIKQHCKCIDDFIEGIKFYYVDGNPFLEHHYDNINPEIVNHKGVIEINASLGYYRFV